MKRRSFLSLLCAATAAPALPAGGAVTKAAAGYNRFTYGFAVFHARHGGAFGAGDLASAMKVSTGQAQSMLAEMSRDGIIRPAFGNMVEAVQVHGGKRGGIGFLKKTTETVRDLLDHIDALNKPTDEDTDAIPTECRRDTDTADSLTTEQPDFGEETVSR